MHESSLQLHALSAAVAALLARPFWKAFTRCCLVRLGCVNFFYQLQYVPHDMHSIVHDVCELSARRSCPILVLCVERACSARDSYKPRQLCTIASQQQCCTQSSPAALITTGAVGRSMRSVDVVSIFFTMSMPCDKHFLSSLKARFGTLPPEILPTGSRFRCGACDLAETHAPR